jgi:predicted XRE-type DNA-binding protein
MPTTVQASSGNVFADLDLPDADELFAKGQLLIIVRSKIIDLGLSQSDAAKMLGIDRADVSNIINGKLRSVSIERLSGLLNKLGEDVEIRVHPKSGEQARTFVVVS